MARLPRVVLAEIPHHVTQRGNARRFILNCDADRNVYLELLREDIQRCNVTLLGHLRDGRNYPQGNLPSVKVSESHLLAEGNVSRPSSQCE